MIDDDDALGSREVTPSSQELAAIVSRIEKYSTNWPRLTDVWYKPVYFQKMFAIYPLITEAVEILDKEMDIDTYIHKSTVHRLYTFIHNILLTSIKYFIPSYPNLQEDSCAFCPLTAFFSAKAICLLFLNQHWPLPNSDTFYCKVSKIPYCKQFKLVAVTEEVSPSNMSLDELMLSMQVIEIKQDLIIDTELVDYIDALELRLAEIILGTWAGDVLDVKSIRVPIPGKENEYVLSSMGEFNLIVQICSLQKMLQSVLPDLRKTCEMMSLNPEDREGELIADKIYLAICDSASSVYSDDISVALSEQYLYESTTATEGMLFLKENGLTTRIVPIMVLRQFRSQTQARSLAEKSKRSLLECVLHPEQDFRAFVIAFHLMIKLILKRTTREEWGFYCYRAEYFLNITDSEYQQLLKRSENIPLFIESFNEACVLYQKKLYIFGAQPMDYVRALLCWIDIIWTRHDGVFVETKRKIENFLKVMFENSFKKPILSVPQDPHTIFKIYDERSKTLAFFEVAKKLLTAGEISNADSVTIGDIDEKGFMSDASSYSIWSDLSFS